MKFDLWLDDFISEKEYDLEEVFVVEGENGSNFIPLSVLVEHIKIAPLKEKLAIKEMIVKLDFHNADIKLYMKHLAKAIAK